MGERVSRRAWQSKPAEIDPIEPGLSRCSGTSLAGSLFGAVCSVTMLPAVADDTNPKRQRGR
jgi:hypothetical protein